MSGARTGYSNWDKTFMKIAEDISERSKDPSTQVGACIVNEDHRVLSLGYNGFPNGCSDATFPWDKTGNHEKGIKYLYVVHAELNAILNAKRDVSGCKLYVTHFPCNECTKAIIQSGIKVIIFKKFYDKDAMATYYMCEAAKVAIYQYNEDDNSFTHITKEILETLIEDKKAAKAVAKAAHDYLNENKRYASQLANSLIAEYNQLSIKVDTNNMEDLKVSEDNDGLRNTVNPMEPIIRKLGMVDFTAISLLMRRDFVFLDKTICRYSKSARFNTVNVDPRRDIDNISFNEDYIDLSVLMTILDNDKKFQTKTIEFTLSTIPNKLDIDTIEYSTLKIFNSEHELRNINNFRLRFNIYGNNNIEAEYTMHYYTDNACYEESYTQGNGYIPEAVAISDANLYKQSIGIIGYKHFTHFYQGYVYGRDIADLTFNKNTHYTIEIITIDDSLINIKDMTGYKHIGTTNEIKVSTKDEEYDCIKCIDKIFMSEYFKNIDPEKKTIIRYLIHIENETYEYYKILDPINFPNKKIDSVE